MTCICGCLFCNICGQQIQGYDHFANGKCGLWTGAEGLEIIVSIFIKFLIFF